MMLFENMLSTCFFLLFLLFQTVHSRSIVHTKNDALIYLKQYGYTTQQCGNSKIACSLTQPNFESMLRDFQQQFKLPVTGRLDYRTRQFMNQPRCGIPDRKSSSLFVQNFNADNRWDRRQLTWSFRHDDSTYAYWIEQAFRKWKEVLPQFEFRQVCSTCDADIFLSFKSKAHDHERNIQDNGFDSNVLAHAYYPKDGTVHFNREITWTHSFGQHNNMYTFYLVAVHELGHSLGYLYEGDPHNVDDKSSIMYPSYLNLNKDNLFTEADRQAIRNIYPDGGHGDRNSGGQIHWNGNNWAHACDFRERNLKNVQIAAELCGPECSRTDGCTHFAWNTYNGGTCWMKTGAISKNDAFSTNDQTMVCGVVDSSQNRGTSSGINWNGNNWAHACDFHERNLKNVQIAAELCGPECSRTDGCTHFAWNTYNGGTCWMKTGDVSKSNAFSTNDQTMVCGVVNSK